MPGVAPGAARIRPWSAPSTGLSGVQGLVLLEHADHLKEMLHDNISQNEADKNRRGHPKLSISSFLPIVPLKKQNKTKTILPLLSN